MANRQKHSDLIYFIERVFFVKKEKSPILRRWIIISKILHTLNLPVNYHLQISAKFLILAGIGGFGASYPEDALSKETLPGFSKVDQANSRLLI